ncbi:MAG: hypothetical protein U0559_04875 [Anaerolineae bacterium]
MLLAFGHGHSGFARTQRFSDDRAAAAFGAHLARHRIFTPRGGTISRISTAVTFTPQRLGHFVEFGAQYLVDVLTLRQHIVQRTSPDHGARSWWRYPTRPVGSR